MPRHTASSPRRWRWPTSFRPSSSSCASSDPPPGCEAAAGSGRCKLLSRLGREAEDPISEFLELCLAYERIHPPSLQGLLHWLESSDVEIKRDPEQGRQHAVRVMTVHGAKGLQAPIVFLPDTCQLPDTKEPLLWMPGATHGRGEVVLWPPRSAFREQVAEAARRRAAERQMQEYRRLLYVAMTRASDRLIVCGWLTPQAEGRAAAGVLASRHHQRHRRPGRTR